MSYYDTIDDDVKRAKEILARGQTVFLDGDAPLPAEANFGGAIYGGDNYAAYKLLESFVAEIERLRETNADLLEWVQQQNALIKQLRDKYGV